MPSGFSPNVGQAVREFLRASDMLLNPVPATPKLTVVELDLICAYVGRLSVAFPEPA